MTASVTRSHHRGTRARRHRGATPLAIALFVVVVAALVPACSLSSPPKGYDVTATFSRAIGLYPNSTVRVQGISVGQVTKIRNVGDQVVVTLRVKSGTKVPADATAALVPASLLGERYVQLFPAWKTGQPKLKPGATIPVERTSVPVEPDETLAALKHLLDSIDPKATGELVTNLAADLTGTGKDFNDALAGLGTITETLGAKDQQVAAIIDHFDKLTATLATRDQTLGRVLDAFARTTDALADERTAIQGLLSSLASLSTNTLDIVNEHHVRLENDLTVLSRTLRLVGDNVDQLDKVLLAGPTLVSGPNFDGKAGLVAAYNKDLHALDLRDVVSPDVYQLFKALGLPGAPVCVPELDVECDFAGILQTPGIDVPNILPAPANATAPTPAAKKAKADASAPKKKSGGLGGILRSMARVFG